MGFQVSVAGGEVEVAPHFLDDVLYGFETIESARRLIVGLGVAAVSAAGGTARIATVETAEEIAELLNSSRAQPPEMVYQQLAITRVDVRR